MSTVHQSQLAPADNKFHVGNGDDGKHYWLVPPEIYEPLNTEFRFDFDPCPHPLLPGFDGLTCEWGQSNWVNPPFGSIIHQGRKKGPTAWMRKAIEEQRKGRLSVVVYPVDKWILLMLSACGVTEVRNLGDVRWLSIEDRQPGKGTGRHIACFILRPRPVSVLHDRGWALLHDAHGCAQEIWKSPTGALHIGLEAAWRAHQGTR